MVDFINKLKQHLLAKITKSFGEKDIAVNGLDTKQQGMRFKKEG